MIDARKVATALLLIVLAPVALSCALLALLGYGVCSIIASILLAVRGEDQDWWLKRFLG